MSSSYYSRVENTVVSGSALQSSLTPEDVRALNFDEAVHNLDALAPSLTAVATANTDVTVSNLIQAAVSRQNITCGNQTGGAAQRLALLPDSISAALAYIQLFNLTSSASTGNVKRLLTFQNAGVQCAGQDVLLGVASGVGTSNVQVALDGIGATNEQILFDASVARKSRPGLPRYVYVYSPNTSTSAPSVIFDVQNDPFL